MARFLNGLNQDIQDVVGLQQYKNLKDIFLQARLKGNCTLFTKNMPLRTPLMIRRKKTSHSKVSLLNHLLKIQKSISILHLLLRILRILHPSRIMSLILLHLNPNLRKKQVQWNILNVWNIDIRLSIVQTKGR